MSWIHTAVSGKKSKKQKHNTPPKPGSDRNDGIITVSLSAIILGSSKPK